MLNPLRNRAYHLLRRSESFFKTDMVYLARGGFWLTIGQSFAAVSTFLLAVAFANLLPRDVYGTYKYILAIGSILSVFTLLGMSTAVTQAVAKSFDGVLMPVFKAQLRWGLVGSLVSFIGSYYYYLNGNMTLSAGLAIIGIFMPAMEPLGTYSAVWYGKKRFDIATKYFAISHIVSVGFSITTAFFTNNVLVLVLIYFTSWTAFRFIFFRKTLSEVKPDPMDASATISYGKHLSLMGVIGVLANYADRILIFHYVGAIEAAIYSIAIAIPEQIKGSFKNIGHLSLPKFSEQSQESLQKSIWEKIGKMAVVLIIVTILYIVTAPFIFRILFPRYLDSIIYSQMFATSLITAISVIPLSFLQAQKKKKELYIYNTSTPIIQLILLFTGAYLYGTLGVVMARIISRFISTAISMSFLRIQS